MKAIPFMKWRWVAVACPWPQCWQPLVRSLSTA